jgi:hypothetical protein
MRFGMISFVPRATLEPSNASTDWKEVRLQLIRRVVIQPVTDKALLAQTEAK